MSTEMEGKLYSMKLHEVMKVEDKTEVKRVPGGWIYTQFFNGGPTSVFVPKKGV